MYLQPIEGDELGYHGNEIGLDANTLPRVRVVFTVYDDDDVYSNTIGDGVSERTNRF